MPLKRWNLTCRIVIPWVGFIIIVKLCRNVELERGIIQVYWKGIPFVHPIGFDWKGLLFVQPIGFAVDNLLSRDHNNGLQSSLCMWQQAGAKELPD